MREGDSYLSKLAERVESRLELPEARTPWPALVLLSGLPATGKSYLSRRLAEQISFAIVQTDAVRKALFLQPTYDNRESRLVYQVCHQLIARLLARGVRVIFDATNLMEGRREALYRLADKLGAKLIIVRTVAPEQVIRERLGARAEGADAQDKSDATWEVYQKMQRSEEPICHPHLVVDTSLSIEGAVRKILRAIRQAPS